MFKKALLLILTTLCTISASAQLAKDGKLISILQIKDPVQQNRELIGFLRTRFEAMPAEQIQAERPQLANLFKKYDVPHYRIAHLFLDAIYKQRINDIPAAEAALEQAINKADDIEDNYLLYTFFTRLGFIRSGTGNTIGAVTSFRLANKQAMLLDEPRLQVVVYINISDIYYKNNFYDQSLFYLDQAQQLINDNSPSDDGRLQNVVYINKAENFFRLNDLDSLKKYDHILNTLKDGSYRVEMYRKRTAYYLAILRKRYADAIKQITALKTDTSYRFDIKDDQNLAKAYFRNGQNDSAELVIDSLLAKPALKNHPEITGPLHKLLGMIAEKRKAHGQALESYKTALDQAFDQIDRSTRVGNISSQIKMDEMEGEFMQKDEQHRRERLLLIFILVAVVLISAILFMVYLNMRQKRHYEKLLYDAKRSELSFINSHEVRKHLSNILGLINVLKDSKDKQRAYIEIEDHLLTSSEGLDNAIKSISQKLDES